MLKDNLVCFTIRVGNVPMSSIPVSVSAAMLCEFAALPPLTKDMFPFLNTAHHCYTSRVWKLHPQTWVRSGVKQNEEPCKAVLLSLSRGVELQIVVAKMGVEEEKEIKQRI